MADIIHFGHQEKLITGFCQSIVNSASEILIAACIKMVSRIFSDIERQGYFDFEASEFFIRDEIHLCGAGILEQVLKYTGGSTVNPVCECGGTFRNKKKRSKTLLTVLGEVNAERDIQQCDRCGAWKAVQDTEWNAEGTGLSPGVRKLLSEAGAALTFDEGAGFIRKFAGLTVTDKAVERIAEGTGRDMMEQEDETVRDMMRGEEAECETEPACRY